MIIIISAENDYSTSKVIRWLLFLSKKFIRINEDDTLFVNFLESSDFEILYKKNSIKLSEIETVWYRRGNLNFKFFPRTISGAFNENLENYNFNEIKSLTNHFHYLFDKKKVSLSNFLNSEINKLNVLDYCSEIELSYPNYLITQSKSRLTDFFKENNGSIISKPLRNSFVLNTKESLFSSYTHKVSLDEIENLPNNFTPTFFQVFIEKEFEIRTVYLNGDFYSMAIFSQNNDITKVDFRNYDNNRPNRLTPYVLSEEIEKKIATLLRILRLNFASIDFIMDKNNKLYFLEVNPVGQFGMTSYPNNYNLEKKIAEFL